MYYMPTQLEWKSRQTAIVQQPQLGTPVRDKHTNNGNYNADREYGSIEHTVHKQLRNQGIALIEHEINLLEYLISFNLCNYTLCSYNIIYMLYLYLIYFFLNTASIDI